MATSPMAMRVSSDAAGKENDAIATSTRRNAVQQPHSLAIKLLRRAKSGQLSMFGYSKSEQSPTIDQECFDIALRLILDEDNELHIGGDDSLPSYCKNALPEARGSITRVQFSGYQFASFPKVFGRTYFNLAHLDIRQNSSLTCIDSIISQLPQLASLNLANCPNLRTVAPLGRNRKGRRTLRLQNLWIRGCNLSTMRSEEWGRVFDNLAESTGPLEMLTLSGNRLAFLHENVVRCKSLAQLFIEDNGQMTTSSPLVLPENLGDLSQLTSLSLCGNNLRRLPRTIGRLDDQCDLHLRRNSDLAHPPQRYLQSIQTIRDFYHEERMKLVRGMTLFVPHFNRARIRANERLYKPGGSGYYECKTRFEEVASERGPINSL